MRQTLSSSHNTVLVVQIGQTFQVVSFLLSVPRKGQHNVAGIYIRKRELWSMDSVSLELLPIKPPSGSRVQHLRP